MSWGRRPKKDIFYAGALFIGAYLLVSYFDFFEFLYEATRLYEDWELDEIILLIIVAPVPLVWFIHRDQKRIAEEVAVRRRVEEALVRSDKMKSLGVLAGGVAHELNNQLLPILTMSELVEESLEKDSPNRRKVTLIRKAAEAAKDTVYKILQFSRGGNEIALSCEVSRAWQTLEPLLGTLHPSHIAVEVDCDGSRGLVDMSESDFQSVIVNLFNNAVQAIAADVGTIMIEAYKIDQQVENVPHKFKVNSLYHIQVKDNGPGIPEAMHEKVFDPFFTTKPPGQGVGLGLSIIHSIIEEAGGIITMDSMPGRGTIFDIYLPLEQSKSSTLVTEGETCHG